MVTHFLDLFFGMLQVRAQRISQSVGEINQPDKYVEVENLLFREMRLQGGDVGIAHAVDFARELFRELQCCLLFWTEAAVIAVLQRLPILLCQPDSLRRSEMMLQSIAAGVDHGDAYVHHLVQAAVQRSPNASIESQESL